MRSVKVPSPLLWKKRNWLLATFHAGNHQVEKSVVVEIIHDDATREIVDVKAERGRPRQGSA